MRKTKKHEKRVWLAATGTGWSVSSVTLQPKLHRATGSQMSASISLKLAKTTYPADLRHDLWCPEDAKTVLAELDAVLKELKAHREVVAAFSKHL